MANPFNVFIGPDGTEYEVEDAWARKALHTRRILLSADGWSGTYPYEQTVAVEGVTASDSLHVVGVVHADGNTEDQDKAIDKAAGYLMYHEGGVKNGAVTFRAKRKPETDIVVIVKGA